MPSRCEYLGCLRANCRYELDAGYNSRSLRGRASQLLHLPKWPDVLLFKHCVGSHWPEEDVWQRIDICLLQLVLASWRFVAYRLLHHNPNLSEQASALSTRSGHARRYGLAPTRDAAELLFVGYCWSDLQLLDSQKISWLVDKLQRESTHIEATSSRLVLLTAPVVHHISCSRLRLDHKYHRHLLRDHAPRSHTSSVVGKCSCV